MDYSKRFLISLIWRKKMNNCYLDLLAYFGVGGAHPGGFSLTKQLLKDEKISSFDSFLDIGCGTGQTAAFVKKQFNCSVTAVDCHPIMINKAKKRFEKEQVQVALVKEDVQSLSFSDQLFDFALSESVIAFTNISKTLHELARVLKRNGCLLIIEMTAKKQLSPAKQKEVKDLYGIPEVLTEEEWKVKLKNAGFLSVETIRSSAALRETALLDMNPSENISNELYELWDLHHSFINQPDFPLSFHVFRCSFD